jgi:hypothetical protein
LELDLAQPETVNGYPRDLELEPVLTVDAAGALAVDGLPTTPGGLAAAVEAARSARVGPFVPIGRVNARVVVVAADRAAPASAVAGALTQLTSGANAQALVLFASESPAPSVTMPDPAFAAELRAKLDVAPPADRYALGVTEIVSALGTCPSALELEAALMNVSPSDRCAITGAGLAEVMPSCLFANRDQAMTAALTLFAPTEPQLPGHLLLPRGVGPAEGGPSTWGDWLAALPEEAP